MRFSFDPEKVTRHLFGCCSYEDTWSPGIKGWGTSEEAYSYSLVNTEDYDLLLEKFKEAREALVFIARIENRTYGGDWDEIEIARGCAKTALDSIAPERAAMIDLKV